MSLFQSQWLHPVSCLQPSQPSVGILRLHRLWPLVTWAEVCCQAQGEQSRHLLFLDQRWPVPGCRPLQRHCQHPQQGMCLIVMVHWVLDIIHNLQRFTEPIILHRSMFVFTGSFWFETMQMLVPHIKKATQGSPDNYQLDQFTVLSACSISRARTSCSTISFLCFAILHSWSSPYQLEQTMGVCNCHGRHLRWKCYRFPSKKNHEELLFSNCLHIGVIFSLSMPIDGRELLCSVSLNTAQNGPETRIITITSISWALHEMMATIGPNVYFANSTCNIIPNLQKPKLLTIQWQFW